MNTFVLFIFVFTLASFSFSSSSSEDWIHHKNQLPKYDWTKVDEFLQLNIDNHTTPGLVALAGSNKDGILYLKAFGSYTYGATPPFRPPNSPSNPSVTIDTHFDMASLTKIFATTTAAMQFHSRGELDLQMKLADPALLGPSFASSQWKGDIRVIDCLVHAAGFPPDPTPQFWSDQFNCPQIKNHNASLSFDCVPKAYNYTLLHQKLDRPPNHAYVYSDLSMITIAWSLGHLAETYNHVSPQDLLPSCQYALKSHPESGPGLKYHCYYEAYVRKHIYNALSLSDIGFLPPEARRPFCQPAENFTSGCEPVNWINSQMQGHVSDPNAYILGGIAGHAGLFSNIRDIYQIIQGWLGSYYSGTSGNLKISQDTIQLFSKVHNLTQSGRGLGFDTRYDNGITGCDAFPHNAFLHLGYTGTSFCVSPDDDLFIILLTNRVYPTDFNDKSIQGLRNGYVARIYQAFKAHHSDHSVSEYTRG